MIKANIIILSESRFPINRQSIREAIEKVLSVKMINVNVAIEVNFVGDRKMRSLNRMYRGIDRTTDVLSFPLEDIGNHEKRPAGYINPPDDILRLGSIVVSYPQAVMGAAQENCLVDQKIAFLVEHGMMHLLGYHHQENE